ncbi:MAG: HEAT repeat domain-containing protein [Deltaproteobacteria bacterium]|nr:HEAT repeat domain-containing protein [Deltaproteobacteria bacterium]
MSSSSGQLRRTLAAVLRIQPGEGRKTALMFGILFCVVGSFIIGRVARDSLFLSRYSIDYLPFLYIWVALGVSLESYLYSRIADRVRRDRLLVVSVACILVLYLASWLMVNLVGDWFFPVFYVLVELFGSLLIIQSWTLANEVFTTREAKRLFGLIGGGGVASSVVLGFSIRGVVRLMGTEQLLLLSAFLLGGALVLGLLLSRACREDILASMSQMHRELSRRIALLSDWRRILASKHLLTVAGLITVLGLAITLVDYQFKVSARYAYLNQEDQLAAFFGLFYGLTGCLSVLLQVFVTGRILERFGILVSLLLLPAALLVGTIGLLVHVALWSATLLKGGDAVLRYTVNDATVQLLYLPVPSSIRGRAKAFVDGIIRPLAIGLGGCSLAWVLPRLAEDAFGWLLLVLVLAWSVLAIGVRRQYLASLVQTLRMRRLNLDEASHFVPDQAATRVLEEALGDPSEQNVLHALELIPYSPRKDWSEVLIRLLKHRHPQVRANALQRIGAEGNLSHGPVVHACLRDPDPTVLAAAIEAYCAIGKVRAVHTISSFLDHDDLAVQAAAVIGLVRYGGLDGVLSSAERLKAMLESPSGDERAAGARILGEIQVKNFYHPLLKLMTDDDIQVRLSAIRASGRMRSRELLPALVYRLEQPDTRSTAAESLVSFGTQAVPLLSRVLGNESESCATRLAVASILARIGDQASLNALVDQIQAPQDAVRSRVLEAIHRLRLHKPHLEIPQDHLQQSVMDEIHALFELAYILDDIGTPDGSLLRDALDHRWRQSVRRVFRLLSCLLPTRAVDAVFAGLASPIRRYRANALELLDNLLEADLKRLLLCLLDDAQRDRRLEEGRVAFGLGHEDRVARLRALLTASDSWLVTCVLYEAGQMRTAELEQDILTCTTSDDPLVRETALLALGRILPGSELQRTARRHLKDPSEQVSSYAAWLLQGATS